MNLIKVGFMNYLFLLLFIVGCGRSVSFQEETKMWECRDYFLAINGRYLFKTVEEATEECRGN